MARMPIEIIEVGDISRDPSLRETVRQAISLANSLQEEFSYLVLPDADSVNFRLLEYKRIKAKIFMDEMERIRKEIRGFHPFVLAIVDAKLDGADFTNIFGSNRAEKGLGVVTISDVEVSIIPKGRLVAYFLYYFARYALSFIVPNHKNHTGEKSNDCVFDRKIYKKDLLKSMKGRAFCDQCRTTLLSGEKSLSPKQYMALDRIFDMSGKQLEAPVEPRKPDNKRPRAFIGSSSEGLKIANKLQSLLKQDLAAIVWNQGTVFGLGNSTIEALEKAASNYAFGIFVFTPDDEIQMRGVSKPVARDNVLFELGLFTGKLTRWRSFVVHPTGNSISLPSDLLGLTTASYEVADLGDDEALTIALAPIAQQIREAIAQAESA
jgi:predicted nucleotide-binding protein